MKCFLSLFTKPTNYGLNELWFKQILHELDSVLDMFRGNYVQEENFGIVVARFDRIIEIQKLLASQISILETMSGSFHFSN